MTIQEILKGDAPVDIKLGLLRTKVVNIPQWGGIKGLEREYYPDKHPVMNKGIYPDIANEDGTLQPVTRVTCNLQQLAVKRMSELVCGIPVKRVYLPENERQKEVAEYLEKIFLRSRIDTINNERLCMLYASCEVMTLWYSVEVNNDNYGFHSATKLRVRNFSPMNGDTLYPLFDEYGDMVAMSIEYRRRLPRKTISFFDVYTSDKHIKYSTENGEWEEVENEDISILKIPAIYTFRPSPIWENQSNKVFEIEWALSRNGNYLRENSRPLLAVYADEQITYGQSPEVNKAFKDVAQFPKGSSLQYVTWQQAIDNLKFYVEQLRSLFFTELQLPDWSYEKMSQQALSGESRKQMFIDAQLKVKDESGRLTEFFDREVNVVKAFLKSMLPDSYAADIDALPVENQITPFAINDERDTIENLMTANGNKPIISQRESIEQLGWTTDVNKTMEEIHSQDIADAMAMAQ